MMLTVNMSLLGLFEEIMIFLCLLLGKNRKRDISSGSKNDSSTSDKSPTGLSEDGRSPASSRSPPCKRPRTNRVREAPDKAVMTMRDLIYYNPSANPMT